MFRACHTPLTATNPGQFFYNLSVLGTPGETAKITLEVPWPFVTQGNMPIHVYDGVTLEQKNGQWCFMPGNEVEAIGKYIILSDYEGRSDGTGYDPPEKVTVEFEIPIP